MIFTPAYYRVATFSVGTYNTSQVCWGVGQRENMRWERKSKSNMSMGQVNDIKVKTVKYEQELGKIRGQNKRVLQVHWQIHCW